MLITYISCFWGGTVVAQENPQTSPNHWQYPGPEGAVITEVASHQLMPNVIYFDQTLKKLLTERNLS